MAFDFRSIDELMKYIEGAGEMSKKPVSKKRIAPRRRAWKKKGQVLNLQLYPILPGHTAVCAFPSPKLSNLILINMSSLS